MFMGFFHGKRGMVFSIFLVIFTLFILIYAFIQISDKKDSVEKEIGERSFEIIHRVQEGEKALIFLDSAAKMATYQAIYDLQSRGGLSGSNDCGIYFGFNRWNSDDGDPCYVDSNVAKDSLRDLFVTNLVARLASHPTVDFVGNLPQSSMIEGEVLSDLQFGSEQLAPVIPIEGRAYTLSHQSTQTYSFLGQDHSVTVGEISSDSAVLVVASVPQSISLSVGETKEVDLTGAAVGNDLSITLQSVSGTEVVLVMRSLSNPLLPSGSVAFDAPTATAGEVELVSGYRDIYSLAMQGGSPYMRAFMRMLTLKEGAPRPINGISPYRVVVGGNVVSDPHGRAVRVGNRNFFEGYTGHPGILVGGSYGRSSAAGRYQFLGSTWRSWAERTPNGASDFSPANQDLAVYMYLEHRRIASILEEIGSNPDSNSESFRNLWKKIMAPASLPGGARGDRLRALDGGSFQGVPGGKGIGGIWASLPYGCYSNQGCHGGDSARFRETADVYVNLLREELSGGQAQAPQLVS